MAGIPGIISRTLNILTYETSDAEEGMFADLVINPDLDEVRLDELDRAGEIIRAGRRIMQAEIYKLKKGFARYAYFYGFRLDIIDSKVRVSKKFPM
ncbi:MAG: hypothetical protein PHT79_08955 [Syntrophomonadaceae bacterium]|nr:hypothetical protein [Syntrophomonadaceae bacterium]MDD4549869.1 hypothetical protein [Syntrophomonadaceae bacterium]